MQAFTRGRGGDLSPEEVEGRGRAFLAGVARGVGLVSSGSGNDVTIVETISRRAPQFEQSQPHFNPAARPFGPPRGPSSQEPSR